MPAIFSNNKTHNIICFANVNVFYVIKPGTYNGYYNYYAEF